MTRQMTLLTDAQLRRSNIDPDGYHDSIADFARVAEQHGGFVDESTLRIWGIDPDDDSVLWIPEHGAPAFQFRGKALRPIVAEINKAFSIPDEVQDACGLADWWLLPNGRMPNYEAPVEHLDQLSNEQLLDAALAEVMLG
jgi:hypothetical protein